MAVTMKQVREALDPEEPNYQQAAALGPEALPHLATLINSADPMLASKATYLASLIEDERAADVVRSAARSSDPIVRVAAAAAAANLETAGASDVLRELASDPDPGVRKVARAPGRTPRRGVRSDSGDRIEPRPASTRIVTGLMPGEEQLMPGTRSRLTTMPGGNPTRPSGEMSGDRGREGSGLMPGEKPGHSGGSKGGMPR